MILTTAENVAGYRTVTTHGLARGNTLRARHVGRDIMAFLRSLVGGEISDYTKMMAEAREQALDRMIEEARALGANAVVSVRFSTSYIMANVAELLVYGTAVTLEPND
ncbi:MAG: YbjQ family protein [Acidobacteriota bacterium]